MISLNLHVNGDISLYACQGPAGLPDVKAKSISRPLPSCPSMHFIGTTLSLCSPALFPNELIGKREEGGRQTHTHTQKKRREKILLAPTKQVRSRLYHRGCFKVILFPLNINQIRLQLRIILNSIWKKQAGSPLIVYSSTLCSSHCLDLEYFVYMDKLFFLYYFILFMCM